MDIVRLRYFRAVVEAGGLSRAARLLFVTPGALSKAMRQLEGEFGHELFARQGRTLVLTEAGRALYGASEPVLDEYQRMCDAVAGVTPRDRPLRLGSFEMFTTYFLGALIDGELAGRDVFVLELGAQEIGHAILERQIDVGLTYAPYPDPELELDAVAEMEFAIYARRGAFQGVPFEQIAFAIPNRPVRQSAHGLLRLDGWPVGAPARTVRYRFGLLESALEMARRGHCAVFLPIAMAALHNETVRRPCRLVRLPGPRGLKAVRQTVYMVTRRGEREAGVDLEDVVAGVKRVCRMKPKQ